MMFRFVLIGSVLLMSWGVGPCPEGVKCKDITLYANANTLSGPLTFQCRFAGNGTNGNVLLLHGFPERASMYDHLMLVLAKAGYNSVACDQRGYSPQASPLDVGLYNYTLLREDVFGVADASSFDKFHLVGHDHGAALGWFAAGSELGKKRLLSYTALSVPHVDAFSRGLYGPEADVQQQCASQYFTMFVETDAATKHLDMFCEAVKLSSGFDNCSQVQTAMNWYPGGFGTGVIAGPPIMSVADLLYQGTELCSGIAVLRGAWGEGDGEVQASGSPQTTQTGDIDVPTLFVCGKSDSALLCNHDYALATKNYCTADYTYLLADCGHDLTSSACDDREKVVNAIVSQLQSVTLSHVV